MFLARAAVQTNPEMVEDLPPAARERLADARAALLQGSPTGIVYLAGVVVEMVLKHATFRAQGLGPHDLVQAALAPVRFRLNHWVGPVRYESYTAWSSGRSLFERRLGIDVEP